jgi:thiosulfate/3-mercaptopyruvate sulfurtransferase
MIATQRCLALDAFDALQGEGAVCLLDIGSPARFAQAHLPGAIHINPMALLKGYGPAPGDPQEASLLQAYLAPRLGASAWGGKQPIVIYDDEGGAWAGRLVWTLELFGLQSWAVVDGGLIAWAEAKRPLERGAPADVPDPRPSAEPPRSRFPHPEVWATKADVLAALAEGATCLWDARSPGEYLGAQRTALRNGHLPGAVNVPVDTLLDPHRGARLRTDLAEHLGRAGIDGRRPIMTQCHSHHRSGLAYLVGRLLSWPIAAYAGSWAEWGNDPQTPLVSGPNPYG